MSDFYLRIEAVPGASIEAACEQAQRLADTLRITVTFDFNGVHCMAIVGGEAKALADGYDGLAGESRPHRIATSHPRAHP